jgi:hypothetical protein
MQKLTPHTDDSARRMVKRFCNQVFWLRKARHIYEELFEKEESRFLLEKTAPSFFSDLNTILQNYLLLEFAKMTDPPKSGKNENFAVENLVVSIAWPSPVKDKLQMLNEKTKLFRCYVAEARNKVLAHFDKTVFMDERTLGSFPKGEDEIFLRTLEEICNIAHEACFGSVFGQMVLAVPGDVINLKRCLLNGLAFNQLLSENEGQEKTKLYSYLQKARQENETKERA